MENDGVLFVVGCVVGALISAFLILTGGEVIRDTSGEITIKPKNVHYHLTLATDEQILKYEKGKIK